MRRRPAEIPPDAVERYTPDHDGVCASSDFFVGDVFVARVSWDPDGSPGWLIPFDNEGQQHGLELEWSPNGRRKYEAHWHEGKQHGAQRQWDERGRLLCETWFVHGTGRDLWWDRGHLSESRDYVDGQRDGVEQWWFDRRTVWEETWFRQGVEHGVARQWDDGRLRPGFPKFYVRGEQVTLAQYRRAAISDPTLRPYITAENRPYRKLPYPRRGLAP